MSGWKDPIGQTIIRVGVEAVDVPWQVIGVMKDIHFGMAKRLVEPMLLMYDPLQRIYRELILYLSGLV